MSTVVPCSFSLPDFDGDPDGAREVAYAALALTPVGIIQHLLIGLMVVAATTHPEGTANQVPLTPAESDVLAIFTGFLREASQERAAKRSKVQAQRGLQ